MSQLEIQYLCAPDCRVLPQSWVHQRGTSMVQLCKSLKLLLKCANFICLSIFCIFIANNGEQLSWPLYVKKIASRLLSHIFCCCPTCSQVRLSQVTHRKWSWVRFSHTLQSGLCPISAIQPLPLKFSSCMPATYKSSTVTVSLPATTLCNEMSLLSKNVSSACSNLMTLFSTGSIWLWCAGWYRNTRSFCVSWNFS